MGHSLLEIRPGLRRVFLRDMVLPASIGVYAHERRGPQRVRINVDLAVHEGELGADELSHVFNYELVAAAVREIVGAGHVRLVETLAERIATSCLAHDLVARCVVRVEKLDILAEAESAGIEIVRDAGKTRPPPGEDT